MPTKTLDCGCTLDTDFVDEAHDAKGPPYHASKGGVKVTPAPTEPPEAPDAAPDAEAESEPTKPFWKKGK